MGAHIWHMVAEYWHIASVLGGTHRLACFARLVSVPLRKKLLGPRPMKVHISFKGKDVHLWVRDGADIAILREIFVEEEYATSLSVSPRSIVDVGGHAGFASIYLALSFPDARIRTYEPDPSNFAILERNAAAFPNIRPFQLAVSDQKGRADFFAGTSSISSSLLSRPDSNRISVDSITLDDILGEKADLVKFDIEGAEHKMFVASRLRHTCPAYIGEIHYDLMGCSRSTFLDLFPSYAVSERSLTRSRSLMTLLAVPPPETGAAERQSLDYPHVGILTDARH